MGKQMGNFMTPRDLPEWYLKICSYLCISIKLLRDEEIKKLIQYTSSLTRLHLEVAHLMAPTKLFSINKINEIAACHYRFCDNQTKNDKTRTILVVSFGRNKANKYMR